MRPFVILHVALKVLAHNLVNLLLAFVTFDLAHPLLLLNLDLFFSVLEELFEHAPDNLVLGTFLDFQLLCFVLLSLELHFSDGGQVEFSLVEQACLLACLFYHLDQFAVAMLAGAQLAGP